MCVTVPKSSAASGGFGTVSAHGSREGPPALAGLFSGGMPQLRSRGGPSGAHSAHSSAVASQSDSSTSVSARPGLYCHCHRNQNTDTLFYHIFSLFVFLYFWLPAVLAHLHLVNAN